MQLGKIVNQKKVFFKNEHSFTLKYQYNKKVSSSLEDDIACFKAYDSSPEWELSYHYTMAQ